jgi:two-component system phosphate regulon sensor histidine kinase PhoR
VKRPRSIIFYAWTGLAAQAVLLLGVFVFIVAGASYQRSAIVDLQQKAHRMQLTNLMAENAFLDAQRAVRGYQATGQGRFLQSYNAERDLYVLGLADMRRLAWPGVLGAVAAQARLAGASFTAADQALAAPPDSRRATALYGRATLASNAFVNSSNLLQQHLTGQSNALASRSERALGVGLGPAAAILVAALMAPMIAVALALRWASGPLHDVTSVVRRRALGDMEVRAAPRGPADIRDLATSLNFLADESDRLRNREAERARLLTGVRKAATRIREHLRGQAVIREAVAAIQEYLAIDFVWVGLVSGDKLTLADTGHEARDQMAGITGYLPPDSVTWLTKIYQERSSYCVQDLHSRDAEEIPAEIRKILASLGTASLLLTPFGAGPTLLGAVTLLRNDPGKPWTPAETEAVESLAGDIGRGLEQARLYESEERLVSELKSLDQAKTSFVASSSHDLRTPLTSILGYVEMMADGDAGKVSTEQAHMLDAVGRNARRLQTLLEDMLTISKIELGSFTSDLRPLDLGALVRDAADDIRPTAEEGGLTFVTRSPDGDLTVNGDADQLARVVLNLLSNAVKYTPRGGRVTLTLSRDAGDAAVTVTDTGIGIPAREQASLFTRFFRASNAVNRAYPGSGLGLSIVRSIVANHHGHAELTSKEGAGTTITVRIPLLSGEPQEYGPQAVAGRAQENGEMLWAAAHCPAAGSCGTPAWEPASA